MTSGNHNPGSELEVGRSPRWLGRELPLCVAFVLLFCVIWIRYTGITRIGMMLLGDGHYYLRMGKLWLDEGPVAIEHYRPMAFLIQALAIKAFGYNDIAVKLVHAGFDVASIALMYAIAWRLTRNLWLALIPPMLYAFLPYVIAFARDEMIHAPSTTFVLLSFAMILVYRDAGERKRLLRFSALFLSGLSLSAACHIHQELALLILAWLGFIFVTALRGEGRAARSRRFGADVLAFGCGGVLLAGIFLAAIGPAQATEAMLYLPSRMNMKVIPESARVAPGPAFAGPAVRRQTPRPVFGEKLLPREKIGLERIDVAARVVLNSLEVISGRSLYSELLLLAVAIMLLRALAGKKDDPAAVFMFVVIAVYAFGYAAVVGRFPPQMVRLFLPIFPFALLAIGYWLPAVLGMLMGRWAVGAALLGTIGLVLIHPHVMSPRDPFLTRTSYYREVHDVLSERVDEENRLLVTPWRFWHLLEDGGFSHPIYFGPNAIHIGRLKPTGESIDDLIARLNVKYLYIGRTGILPRRPTDRDFYGLYSPNPIFGYTQKKELQILDGLIARTGGVRIFESKRGAVYQIRDVEGVQGARDGFDLYDFEGGEAGAEDSGLSKLGSHSGRFSRRIRLNGSTLEGKGFSTPWHALDGFDRVRFAFWYGGFQIKGGIACVRPRYADAQGREIDNSEDVPRLVLPRRGSLGWAFRSVTIASEMWPPDAARISFEFVWLADEGRNPEGTVLIDDITVTRIGSEFGEPEFYRERAPFAHLQFYY